MEKIIIKDQKKERIEVKQLLGFFIKLVLLTTVYILCLCVVYGIGTSSSLSFSDYTHVQQFLLCILIMLAFIPLVFLIYRIKRLKNRILKQLFIGFISLYSMILIGIFALMAFD